MAMEGQGKKVVYELVIAFVVILLLVVLRPLFMGQVATASTPYNITVTDSSTGLTTQQTITPSATLSTAQTDTIYSVVIFLVALIALVVLILTIAGKI